MYKYVNDNDMFDSFIDTFKIVVEKLAPIQTVEISDINFKN